jgi:hypothetical protein
MAAGFRASGGYSTMSADFVLMSLRWNATAWQLRVSYFVFLGSMDASAFMFSKWTLAG